MTLIFNYDIITKITIVLNQNKINMPSHELELKIVRGKKPTFGQIFHSFEDNLPIKLNAKVLDPAKWRPQGENIYEIKIFSIKREVEHPRFISYEAYAQLLGMNSLGNFPEHFCWPSNGWKHQVKLCFNSKGKINFYYEEYLTL